MKVALIGASGNVGSRLLRELVNRKHQVTAIARNPSKIEKLAGVTPTAGDANDVEALVKILHGHDAVISSVYFSQSDPAKLVEAVRQADIERYIVVGGAGSLNVKEGGMLVNSPLFPPEYVPEASAGVNFLDYLRGVSDLKWTFISPSLEFSPGPRTGTYRKGRDELLFQDGVSKISIEDYAVALVDELEQPNHIRQRFTVAY